MSTLPSDRFDVIVVGAGPAGVTAAMALGKAGFSVLLCEAGVFPGAENWSGAVYFAENIEHPDAFGKEIVERAPFERRLAERGAFLYNGHSLIGASLKNKDVFRSCYTVLRPVYDRYLAEVAREQGVVLACETTVQSLIRHRGRVVGVHTERGPAYADVVFLAEGDASHLVTQEGYEKVDDAAKAEGAPHFLQGVKEVISLDPARLEERFGLAEGEGAAYEMLLRNATRKGRTIPLNMGGFLYTNRDSISLGFVLPLDNLAHHFQGDHNLLMEWFKGLPEIARLIEGGELTSYGAKIIRGGGYREIPRLVDDGLAIGGAASGVGVDFPYPNFTGPATAMGLYFARAVKAIAADHGGPGRSRAPGESPFTAAALERSYLRELHGSHYWKSVEYLRDWPGYIERTRFFFEKQIDLVNNVAYIQSRPELGALKRWSRTVRLMRRVAPARKLGELLREQSDLAGTVGLPRLVGAAITPGNLLRVLWNTVGALLPFGRKTRLGAADPDGAVAGAGVAEATAHDGSRLRAFYRVRGGQEQPGRAPLWFRWLWRRYGPALASSFSEVYTNDDAPIGDKLAAAARHVGGRVSIWDAVLKIVGALAYGATAGLQVLVDAYRAKVKGWDFNRFRDLPVYRLLEDNRGRIRLDEEAVTVHTGYDAKLATITYQEGHHSHIKVLWPEGLSERSSLSRSALWNVCPAKVYEVRHNQTGAPGVVVNYENCIKCETCWRASDDVHWSRATQQRLIYQTYTPAQTELHRYLRDRSEPRPRIAEGGDFWERALAGSAAASPSAEAAAALAGLLARLERVRAGLSAFSDELARSPLALEEGRHEHLGGLVEASAESYAAAHAIWSGEALCEVREAAPDTVLGLWPDAGHRFSDMLRHAGDHRWFWTEVIAKQLADHHFTGIERYCRPLVEGAEIRISDLHDEAAADWSRAVAWRAREGRPGLYDGVRQEIRDRAEHLFGLQEVRELEHGGDLSEAQVEWLRSQTAAALSDPREAGFGRRDVLLEELAALDPALAWSVSSHLLAADLLAGSDDPLGEELREVRRWAAAVTGGRRAVDASGEPPRLDVEADFVPASLADCWVVVADGRAWVLEQGEGVELQDVGTVGLIGARPRRLVARDAATGAGIDVAGRLDAVTLEAPAAGEPWACTLELGVADYLAIVRGAGEYLLRRSRDHAAGRVQFPGAFEDEAGRDTIAKFGAVKAMLAQMEAHRYTLEAASMDNPCGDIDQWTGLAAAKVMASEAFGPSEGSFSYDAGQLFGGTAFSEDDVIAKFYRDSAPFRFLLGHDDALRVAMGRRRLQAVAGGDALVPVTPTDERALEEAAADRLLGELVERFAQGRRAVEQWAREHVGQRADEMVAWAAGAMVVQALRAKVGLTRAVWRIEAGVPTEAILEAARLVVDRFHAAVPALLEEAELAAETVAVGGDLVAGGEPFPAPAIEGAQSYREVLEEHREHGSGEWLMAPFDAQHPRYIPEVLANDEKLRGTWDELEAEFIERYVEPRFDGLIYGRYLEKLHLIPERDLDYMVDRGFMRMPIDEDLGGEHALKAEYYILCMLIGRYGDAALSLAIMANTSIGTTPTLIGLYQDLPRARAELQRVHDHPEELGEIRDGIDRILDMMSSPDLKALTEAYTEVLGLVKKRVARSMVLKYLGGGFLRAFFKAGAAGQQRDLEGFEQGLRRARELMGGILEGVDERLVEYPRRERAHELFLKMISAGYISAFALTEPTAGSDSGGVKTVARLESRRVHRDQDGAAWFWLDEAGEQDRRYLVDADRLEFDYEAHRILYRYADDAEPALVDHSEYDYAKDAPERTRFYLHGDRKIGFTDIAQIRTDAEGNELYEFWVLNGAKMWITNGRFSHCMALYARTEPEGVTGFMVDRHAEGLVVGADEEKLGQRGSPTNELSLNNVRVPREGIIGFRGRGQVNALETLNTGRAGLAVTTHATVQEMIEDALPYVRGESSPRFPYQARERQRPLERYWMGRSAEELVGTAATTYELVGMLDSKRTSSVRMESAIGKYYGSEAEHEAIDWMERLRGLEGQTWIHRIEKTRRDARVLNIYEGTNEVQRFLLLKDLVQRVLPAWKQEVPSPERVEDDLAHADLARDLERAKARLAEHVGEAVARFDQQVWANVGLQSCFFRLSEIAGLTKVIDALLYRLEWIARVDAPREYRERITRYGRLYVRRALMRIGVLERRYATSYRYLVEGRHTPETQLGFLSLEESGAPREGWGRLPERLRVAPVREGLAQDVEIAVLVKPVPMSAPRPRLSADDFAEPSITLGAADEAALAAALRLKRRDPQRVRVTVYSLAGNEAPPVLRETLARGADSAVHLSVQPGEGDPEHDARYVARAVAGALRRRPADLVLCGDSAADTNQGVVATYLGARLDCPAVHGIDRFAWTDGAEPALRIGASGWQGRRLDQPLPAVIAAAPDSEAAEVRFDLRAWLRAAKAEIEEIPAASLVSELEPLSVRHVKRAGGPAGDAGERAQTPLQAAEVLLGMVEGAGSGGDDAVAPFAGRMLTLGEQPQEQEGRSCLMVLQPVGSEGFTGAMRADVEAAATLAAGVDLPLHVVLPVDGDDHAAAASAAAVIAAGEARRVYVVSQPGLSRFGTRGHLDWLEEFWAMYRGRPQWLVGPAWARDLFGRFVATGVPGVEEGECWSWFNAEALSNGGGVIRASTGIYGGTVSAEASLPIEGGLRVLTLGRNPRIELGHKTYAMPGAVQPEVFHWQPHVEYRPEDDPVAALLAELGGGEETLEEAEFIIDVGYGAGGRAGIDDLAEPLRKLLAEELGLPRVMIGATRKVTQDLELLPMDRQIGQTGVSVNPKLILALAVSGAPQHVDYIGERATIISFNIDPEAPLMRLNNQRPKPIVHPIVGDVRETVPAFIEAVRKRVRGG